MYCYKWNWFEPDYKDALRDVYEDASILRLSWDATAWFSFWEQQHIARKVKEGEHCKGNQQDDFKADS